MTEDRAHRLAKLLKEIEDEKVLFDEIRKEHNARLEKLHNEVRGLGFLILSGQEELPLGADQLISQGVKDAIADMVAPIAEGKGITEMTISAGDGESVTINQEDAKNIRRSARRK